MLYIPTMGFVNSHNAIIGEKRNETFSVPNLWQQNSTTNITADTHVITSVCKKFQLSLCNKVSKTKVLILENAPICK
jgi:hypothetical protein